MKTIKNDLEVLSRGKFPLAIKDSRIKSKIFGKAL